MGEQYLHGKPDYPVRVNHNSDDMDRKQKDDTDLIIEDNTVYEIDRECYERLKRQRRRKTQEKKPV